jgi:hypothetical protein
MMLKRFLAVWLATTALVLGAGCLSFLNMRDGDDPKCVTVNRLPPYSIYAGVRLDALMISDGFVWFFTDPSMTLVQRARWPFGLLLTLADLPIEAAADTLTLPATITATLCRNPEASTALDQERDIGQVQEMDPQGFHAGFTLADKGPAGQAP